VLSASRTCLFAAPAAFIHGIAALDRDSPMQMRSREETMISPARRSFSSVLSDEPLAEDRFS
jgi:hypothetical protein